MALTLTQIEKPAQVGHRWRTVYRVACDNSYPTNGYALLPSSLGFLNSADDLLVEVCDSYGYGTRYDYTNQKLILYASAGTQVTNATDLSAVTAMTVIAYSKYRSN